MQAAGVAAGNREREGRRLFKRGLGESDITLARTNMKTRILFVDSELAWLQRLRHDLWSMRHEWECVFAQDMAEAAAKLAEGEVAVVASSFKLPDGNGAQLLETAQRIRPSAARVMIADRDSREMLMRTVHSAHRFISRDAGAPAITQVIRTLCLIRSDAFPREFCEMAGGLERMPVMPSVYAELLDVMADDDSDLGRITSVVVRDLSITMRILRLANSALFGARQEISSVFDAVAMVGLGRLKSLALSSGVFAEFEKHGVDLRYMETLWSHSTKTASYCRIIARAEGLDHASCEESLVSGLLHDIGKLVLADNHRERYKGMATRADQAGLPLWQMETAEFGGNHAQLGAYLATLWGLPRGVCGAILSHHNPAEAGSSDLTLAGVVHVADALAHLREKGAGAATYGVLEKEKLASLGFESTPEKLMGALDAEECLSAG